MKKHFDKIIDSMDIYSNTFMHDKVLVTTALLSIVTLLLLIAYGIPFKGAAELFFIPVIFYFIGSHHFFNFIKKYGLKRKIMKIQMKEFVNKILE